MSDPKRHGQAEARPSTRIYVIIPAYNEGKAIRKVIGDIPAGLAAEVVVVSNGSTDDTEARAAEAGAVVLSEARRGYGNACLRGMAYLASLPEDRKPETVVFLDGDYSDYPQEMPSLIRPIEEAGYDLVIGSRALGEREQGAMLPQQVFGNWLATTLIRWMYGVRFTDLGPFRAIRYDRLAALGMRDQTYGWTVEMQVRAAQAGLRCTEVPVRYRRRIGVSKVSGTVKGTVLAGYMILKTIFTLRVNR